jgi:hypothetical protein
VSLVPEAFKTPGITKREILAIRSLEDGTADPYLQRLALSCILKKLCRTYDPHFVPGKPDETNFLQGRGFVGQEIVKLLRIDAAALKEMKDV